MGDSGPRLMRTKCRKRRSFLRHRSETDSRARRIGDTDFNGDFSARKAIADDALATARRLGDPATLVRIIFPWSIAILMPHAGRAVGGGEGGR